MAYIDIHPLGLGLGIWAYVWGIIWILRKDKLKKGFRKNWPDRAFYVWGLTAFISGTLVILNLKFLHYALILTMVIFWGQTWYYNHKAKKLPR